MNYSQQSLSRCQGSEGRPVLLLTKCLLCPSLQLHTEESSASIPPVRLFQLRVLLPLSCVVPPDKFHVLSTPENILLPPKLLTTRNIAMVHCLLVIKSHLPVSHSQLNSVPRHVTSLKLWIRHQTSWSLYQDSETGSSAMPLW